MMFEPVSRLVTHDVFEHQSAFASKFLDSFSVLDWGRMPDAIPYRGKFQLLQQAFIDLKITSAEEWQNFLRSSDALAFRKAATAVLQSGVVTAHLNELADSFPMKCSGLGMITEDGLKVELTELIQKTEIIQKNESYYLLNEAYPETKITSSTVMGKTVWDFSDWKNETGPKAFPFEFDCEFIEDFPRIILRCPQKTLSTEISISEAMLITELPAALLEEVILKAAWIAAFTQFQLKDVSSNLERKVFRIRMGMMSFPTSTVSPFVFLGSSVELVELEAELKKYYSSTVWGKTVLELQLQARARGITEWKRLCTEPAPWLDPQLKTNFSLQYQKMISGITACLSE